MRSDYKLVGPTAKVQVELEVSVAETLAKMENFSKHSVSELANTALKRFIAAHKDFLPREESKK